MHKLTKTQWTIILTAGYLFCQIVADITAVKLTGPILGQFVPAAVFIYAVTFTWRDMVHKQLGKQAAVTMVWVAGIVNVAMAFYFMFTVALPAAPFWQFQTAYAMVLGIVPRIVSASILAEIVSELVDTEIYHHVRRFAPWIRVIASNVVSLTLDSVLFVFLAFAGTMPSQALLGVVIGQLTIKATITLLSIPLIYIVPEKPLYNIEN